MTTSPTPSRVPMTPILDPEVRNRVNAELQSGERLLWAGQPIPSLYALRSLPVVLFGLVFTGFSLFWMVGAGAMMWFSHHGPAGSTGFGVFNCFPLFGLPFFFVGMGLVTSPFWQRRAARRSIYAVTDRRAIVCQGSPWGAVEVVSYAPSELGTMSRVDRSNGAGDLVFQEVLTQSFNSKGHRTSNRKVIGFIAIEDVRDVEHLIRAQLLAPHDARTRNSEV